MDKVIIAAIHGLRPDLSISEMCKMLGLHSQKTSDWDDTLAALNNIWMGIREDLRINSHDVATLDEVIELLLQEIKSFDEGKYEQLSEQLQSISDGGGIKFPIDLVQEMAAIYRDYLATIEYEDEIDDSGTEDNQASIHQGINSDTIVVQVRDLRNHIKEGLLDLNPRWQRTVVWNNKKKQLLISSLLQGIPVPSLIIHKETGERGLEKVLDGKQRLTSITEFIAGTWPLPKLSGESIISPYQYKLSDCSECFWSDIPEGARRKILETKIAKITLEGLSNSELYDIFELYNTQGMKLNPAEIRNAAYHDNPIHAMVFDLVGEGEFKKNLIGDERKLKLFQNQLRDIVGGGKDPKRYAALDIVERYLGYSRSPNPQKQSTKNCIKYYYSNHSIDESAPDVAKEIVESWNLAYEIFGNVENGAFKSKSGRNPRFNKLKTTTSMIVSRLLLTAINEKSLTKQEAQSIVDELDSEDILQLPDNQQTSSIWNHQAKVVCNLIYTLSDYGESLQHIQNIHSDFIQKMRNLYEEVSLF